MPSTQPAPPKVKPNFALHDEAFNLLFSDYSHGDTRKDTNYATFSLEFLEKQLNDSGLAETPYAATYQAFADFCRKSGATCEETNSFDSFEVLTAKFHRDGSLAEAYLPAVFQYNDKLVLRLGNNYAPIEQREGKFYVGSLKGSLIYDKRGQDPHAYYVCFMAFSDKEATYTVAAKTAKAAELPKGWSITPSCFNQLIEDEVSLHHAFFTMKLGGKRYTPLRDLQVGDYLIQSVEHSGGSFGGYNLVLDGGLTVSLNTALNKELQMAESAGLSISQISKRYAGRFLRVISSTLSDDGSRTFVDARFATLTPDQVTLPGNLTYEVPEELPRSGARATLKSASLPTPYEEDYEDYLARRNTPSSATPAGEDDDDIPF